MRCAGCAERCDTCGDVDMAWRAMLARQYTRPPFIYVWGKSPYGDNLEIRCYLKKCGELDVDAVVESHEWTPAGEGPALIKGALAILKMAILKYMAGESVDMVMYRVLAVEHRATAPSAFGAALASFTATTAAATAKRAHPSQKELRD